jgi:hypothetical protein
MRTMDVWYAHLDEDQVMSASRGATADLAKQAKKGSKAARKQAKKQAEEAKRANNAGQKAAQKAHTRDSLQALSKLGELADGKYRTVSQPPIVIPARDLAPMSGVSAGDLDQVVRQQFRALDQGPGGQPPLLLAPAARHEGLGRCGVDDPSCAHVLRADLRVDAGAGARPVRGPHRHRRLPG